MHLIYYYSPPIYHSNWSRCVADLHIDREHLVILQGITILPYHHVNIILSSQKSTSNLKSREVSRFISSVQVLYKKVPRIPFNWKGIGSNKIPQRHGWPSSYLPSSYGGLNFLWAHLSQCSDFEIVTRKHVLALLTIIFIFSR